MNFKSVTSNKKSFGLIFLIFIVTFTFSCEKETIINNITAKCTILGHDELYYKIRIIEKNSNNINLVLKEQVSNFSSNLNYKKINDTTINLYSKINDLTYIYVYNRLENKIIKKLPSNNLEVSIFKLKDNQIIYSVTKLYSGNTITKDWDTTFYYYDSSAVTKTTLVSRSQTKTKQTFEYYRDYEYIDFSYEIGVLSYLFQLNYKEYLPKTKIIESSNVTTTLNYEIKYNVFNFPDKLVSQKDSIMLFNYCN